MGKYLELEDLNTEQYTFLVTYLANGVGSRQLSIDPPDLIFYKPSVRHDMSFLGGGNEKDRLLADNRFLIDCKLEIKKKVWFKKLFFTPIALLYWLSLEAGSRFAWDFYPERPKTWLEFMDRVETCFNKQKWDMPWHKKVAKFLLSKNIKTKENLDFSFARKL